MAHNLSESCDNNFLSKITFRKKKSQEVSSIVTDNYLEESFWPNTCIKLPNPKTVESSKDNSGSCQENQNMKVDFSKNTTLNDKEFKGESNHLIEYNKLLKSKVKHRKKLITLNEKCGNKFQCSSNDSNCASLGINGPSQKNTSVSPSFFKKSKKRNHKYIDKDALNLSNDDPPSNDYIELSKKSKEIFSKNTCLFDTPKEQKFKTTDMLISDQEIATSNDDHVHSREENENKNVLLNQSPVEIPNNKMKTRRRHKIRKMISNTHSHISTNESMQPTNNFKEEYTNYSKEDTSTFLTSKLEKKSKKKNLLVSKYDSDVTVSKKKKGVCNIENEVSSSIPSSDKLLHCKDNKLFGLINYKDQSSSSSALESTLVNCTNVKKNTNKKVNTIVNENAVSSMLTSHNLKAICKKKRHKKSKNDIDMMRKQLLQKALNRSLTFKSSLPMVTFPQGVEKTDEDMDSKIKVSEVAAGQNNKTQGHNIKFKKKKRKKEVNEINELKNMLILKALKNIKSTNVNPPETIHKESIKSSSSQALNKSINLETNKDNQTSPKSNKNICENTESNVKRIQKSLIATALKNLNSIPGPTVKSYDKRLLLSSSKTLPTTSKKQKKKKNKYKRKIKTKKEETRSVESFEDKTARLLKAALKNKGVDLG